MSIEPKVSNGGYGSYNDTGPIPEFWIKGEWKGHEVRSFFDPNTFILRFLAPFWTSIMMAAVVPGEGGYGVTIGHGGTHTWVREYAFESSNPAEAAEFALDCITHEREFQFSDDARFNPLPPRDEDVPLVP